MDNDPRHIAFLVLVHWNNAKQTLDNALDHYGDAINSLSQKDKSLCHALIFGVLRHRESIDWIIRSFSNTPIQKIKPKPLYLLRMGLFQIIHFDRIPDFAAINTSVEIGKKKCGRQTAGFLNAILRKAAKGYETVNLPDQTKNPDQYLSIHNSLPLWLARRWMNRYGFEQARQLCKQINTIPMLTLRTNLLKTDHTSLIQDLSRDVKNITPTLYARNGLRFSKPNMVISELEAFKNGWFQMQDEAAQIVTELLDPKPDEMILDACAGLGGKTGHIAQLMKNTGTLVAIDIEAYKLKTLELEAKRLGLHNIQARRGNIIQMSIKDFDTYFDRVLVDAPCTGLGVLQRNPDTKWKRTKHDITRLAGQQKKILNAAANLVKPGGTLVYAVCSCEPEENEAVVHGFLEKRKDFSIDKTTQFDRISDLMTPNGFLKTYPETNNMDGFFAARLTRKS